MCAAPPLRPADPVARQRMRARIQRLNDLNHPATGMLHYSVLSRPLLLKLAPERLEMMLAAMPNPRDRALRTAAVRYGMEAPEFTDAMRVQEDMLDAFEASLADSDFLIGDAVSLLDLTALPNVARIDQMGFVDLIDACERPRLSAWYARMQARPSWRRTFGELSPRVIEEWQMLGRAAWPKIAPCLRRLLRGVPG
jgi:glutathione S-transferase